MTTWTNTSRNTSSYTSQSKNTSVWDNKLKPGSGYFYDEINLFYDEIIDPFSSLPVYYEGIGALTTWTTVIKST